MDNSTGPSAGDVYVADENGVEEFTASGEFIAAFGPSGAGRVAVDSSMTSSAGDVYVTVPRERQIDKFGSGGKMASSPWIEGLTTPAGFAVDAAGNLYVADEKDGSIVEFARSGMPLNEGKPIVQGLSGPRGIAVDSHGDLYVAEREAGLVEVTPAEGGGFSIPRTIDATPALDVAIDPSTDDVYVDAEASCVEPGGQSSFSIDEFDRSGVLIGVDRCLRGKSSALAVSEQRKDVYATDSTVEESLGLKVIEPSELISPEALTPTVEDESASNITEQGALSSPQLPDPVEEHPGGTGSGASGQDLRSSSAATNDTPALLPATIVKPDAMTRAQKRAKALKACAKEPRKQRAACRRRAEKMYGPTSKKADKKRRRY